MFKHILLFSIFILSATLCFGQDQWSLNKCILYAIENSYQVHLSNIDIAESETNTTQSYQQRYPNVSANTNAFWNFGRSIDPTTNSFITNTFFSNGYSIDAGVTLFDGGRLKYNIQQSEALEKVQHANKDNTINSLTLNVVGVFFEVLFAEDNLANVNVQLKSINDQLDQMTKLVSAGSRAQFEIYDLEAQKATSEEQITIAQNRVDLAYLNLKSFLNLPADFDISISKPDFDQSVYTNIDLITLDEAFIKALDFQPSTRSLAYEIESAAIGVDLARSGYYPTVSFGGSLNTNYSNQGLKREGSSIETISTDVLINNQPAVISTEQVVPQFSKSPYFSQVDNNFGYGFGFNVSIPIYSQGSTKSNINRAKLALERKQIEQKQNHVSLKENLMTYITNAKAAKRTLTASEKTLEARQVAYDNAEKRFDLGAINSYEYISIQDQLNTARTNFLISKYDYVMKVKLLDYFQGYPVGLD